MLRLSPEWDLPLVLSVGKPPFESTVEICLKMSSVKIELLLALTSANSVSDLYTLWGLMFCPSERTQPSLLTNFKTNSIKFKVVLLPHNRKAEETSHRLCPVYALSHYVLRTANISCLFTTNEGHRVGPRLKSIRLTG